MMVSRFRIGLVLPLLIILVLTVFAGSAQAYYNPTLGRFLTRDPGPGAQAASGRTFIPRDSKPRDDIISLQDRAEEDVTTFLGPRAIHHMALPLAANPGVNGPYHDGMNLYQYVQSSPVLFTDPQGTNIYLKSGNVGAKALNNLIHQNVCVDKWDDQGCREGRLACFSFGINGNMKWFSLRLTWLGWGLNLLEATGGMYLMEGEIYNAVDTGVVKKTKNTTIAQDRAWLNWMRQTREGLTDVYTMGWFNCRKYAQKEFSDAP